MISSKFTVLLCLVALCMSFVVAAVPSNSAKAIEVTTHKKSSSVTKSSTKKSSASVIPFIKTSLVSIKTTIKTNTAKTSTSTHVPSTTIKTTLQTKVSSTSSSSNVPSSTLQPFNLTNQHYIEGASSDSQTLSFDIYDPGSDTESDCVLRWDGYETNPPSTWNYCEDNTFTFRVTYWNTHLSAWSYALKHQYARIGLPCISPTDPNCTTTLAHADIKIVYNSGDSSVGEGFYCGGSGNCRAWDNGIVPGYIDSSCKGTACEGKV